MTKKGFFAVAAVFALSLAGAAASSGTGIDGLFRKTLPNGLEVFVMENDSAPLAYVEIAVRAGGVSQVPENAGLFHLYEHMMFKGNSRYKDQKSFMAAMNSLGVGEWNGSTGVDRVNYYFTVPSDKVRDGMEFWSLAVRSPNMDEGELEREKGVVLSEIRGDYTSPAEIAYAAVSSKLFPSCPWRVDSGGNPHAVENATVAQMREIQEEFYVPENSAVFVGGDVSHEEIFRFAEEIFGGWKRSPRAQAGVVVPPKNVSDSVVKLVYPNETTSDSFVLAQYMLRGPDGQCDAGDTYAADVWSEIARSPDGLFKRMMVSNKKLSIADSDYVGAGYLTARASGRISFSAYMKNEGNPAEKADEFLRAVTVDAVGAMQEPSSGFTSGIDVVERRLSDSRVYEFESAEGVLSGISGSFASCGADYFFGYDSFMRSVTEDDIRSFVSSYIAGKNGVLFVSVSPSVFARYEKDFRDGGFEVVTAENAFWWNSEGK